MVRLRYRFFVIRVESLENSTRKKWQKRTRASWEGHDCNKRVKALKTDTDSNKHWMSMRLSKEESPSVLKVDWLPDDYLSMTKSLEKVTLAMFKDVGSLMIASLRLWVERHLSLCIIRIKRDYESQMAAVIAKVNMFHPERPVRCIVIHKAGSSSQLVRALQRIRDLEHRKKAVDIPYVSREIWDAFIRYFSQ